VTSNEPDFDGELLETALLPSPVDFRSLPLSFRGPLTLCQVELVPFAVTSPVVFFSLPYFPSFEDTAPVLVDLLHPCNVPNLLSHHLSVGCSDATPPYLPYYVYPALARLVDCLLRSIWIDGRTER
jgi:hypothetical protein